MHTRYSAHPKKFGSHTSAFRAKSRFGSKNFKRHCDEIISIIREERGNTSLLEEDNLPDRG